MSGVQSKGGGGKKPLNKNQLLKRNRIRNARSIRAEAVAASSSKNSAPNDLSESGGKLKVDQFINSREFEVKQLQLAMHNSKGASSTRIFQALPRKLRRRTASHNVRRIPKRMRNRALREMRKSDQQQVLKNLSSTSRKTHGLNAKQLYRARMSIKLLRLAGKSTSMKLSMPSEITSSKCHVRQKIKTLKRMIKESCKANSNSKLLNNRLGSYDVTGLGELAPIPKGRIKYTKRQKYFTWLPTHIWNAKRSHMMKRWGYQVAWAPTQKCFKLTHRLGGDTCSSDGALCMDSSHIGTMIVKDNSTDTMGDFLKSIIEKLTAGRASMRKYRQNQTLFQGLIYSFSEASSNPLGPCDLFWVQKDTVILRLHPSIYTQVFDILIQYKEKLTIQDCRYSIASVTLKGAKALESLASCLRSTKNCTSFEQFKIISKVTDSSTLPQRCTFAFEAIDPRHLAAPKKLGDPQKKTISFNDILSLHENYPHDDINTIFNKLCSPESRTQSYDNQNTLKEISTRRSKLLTATPNHINKTTVPFKGGDPSIPLVIMKRPKTGDWIVMLPWFWLLPLWHQLNRVPRVYHIGLRQFQQIQYENEQLYFPDDYPFTQLGHLENSLYKREALKTKWDRKPMGKRINFKEIKDIHNTHLPALKGEIGDFFSSDWRFLQILKNGLDYLRCDDKDLKLMDSKKTGQFNNHGVRDINCVNDVLEFCKDYEIKVKAVSSPVEEDIPIMLCKLTKCQKPPSNNTNPDGSSFHLTIQPRCIIAVSCKFIERGHPRDNARIYQIPEEHLEHWLKLAKGVYRPNGRRDHDIKIPLPEIHDLIGFITSGTYHLNSGNGMGIGFIDHRSAMLQATRYVLVRNVGTNIYRLGEWSEISV